MNIQGMPLKADLLLQDLDGQHPPLSRCQYIHVPHIISHTHDCEGPLQLVNIYGRDSIDTS